MTGISGSQWRLWSGVIVLNNSAGGEHWNFCNLKCIFSTRIQAEKWLAAGWDLEEFPFCI